MSIIGVSQRLEQLGIVLPPPSNPAAKYANFVKINGLLYISGKGPTGEPKGKLGDEYSTEEGYNFARETGLEILSVVQSALGSLDHVKKVIKIQGFVNAIPEFEEHHKVLNGCSDLMLQVFEPEIASHARSVFGAISLRDNLPIIVDSIFAY